MAPCITPGSTNGNTGSEGVRRCIHRRIIVRRGIRGVWPCAIYHCRIICRHIDNLWTRRFDNNHLFFDLDDLFLGSFQVPEASAFARSFWTVAMTSFCCDRKASPSFCVKSSFSLITLSTSGKVHQGLDTGVPRLGFKGLGQRISLEVLVLLCQRSACTISSGYVEAISIWVSRESG